MMLPNAGNLYDQDLQEQQVEITKEKQDTLSSLPIMDSLIKWFDHDILSTDSVTEALNYSKQNNIDIEITLRAFAVTKTLLEKKRDSLRSLYDEHTKTD